ncbi:MAG: 16S rRNA (uracil(1498)-N(3))-methyltransferase [Pseudomonadota bacterium]
MRRFYLPSGPQGGEAVLTGQERDHLARVLRLGVGEQVLLLDGQGRQWLAEVAGIDSDSARLTVLSPVEASAEPRLHVWLCVALLRKPPKADWLLQKACELGVRRISFVLTQRAVPRLREADGGQGRLERWNRIAAGALKQCGGTVLPQIDPPRALPEVAAEGLSDGLRLILHESAEMGLSQILTRAGMPERVQLLVGPEGGFSSPEVDLAAAAGFTAVRLGPRVLRAETAALAACAALMYAAGELG